MSNFTAKEEIVRLEGICNESESLFNDMDAMLTRMEENAPRFQELVNYYYSEAWQNDAQAANDGAYDGIVCGILSEDLFYNQLGDRHQLAIRMMELALKMMKTE